MAQRNWVDYYARLELYDPVNRTGKGPQSTLVEIKKAWIRQQKAWHPDRFMMGTEDRDIAEERTKLINQSYQVLSDPDRKKDYDKEWLKRNPWFGEQEEKTSAAPPEISVRWDPPDVQSNLFYDISRGDKRTAKLIIEPRVGQGFTVEILEPESGWLRIIEPVDRRGTPPFTATVEVDTTGLQYNQLYNDDLIFVVEQP